VADNIRRMVRKQLNIDPTQDDALKRLAAERGISESEVVRQAIELFIEHEEGERAKASRAAAALEGLFAEWDATPWAAPPQGLYRFGVYDDLG
jgi:hypothetical protein